MGSQEAVHPGPLRGRAAGGGAVLEWIINRWVTVCRVSEQPQGNPDLRPMACAAPPSGLSIGDRPGSQPLGIVLTIVGVVVLDFCADASEGPIRAYLLDVADAEEQDMALNIHAFSAGKTPNTPKPARQCLQFAEAAAFSSAAFQELLPLVTLSSTSTAGDTMQLCWLQAASKLLFSIPAFEM